MPSPVSMLAIALLIGAWLCLWTWLAKVPMARLQWRGPLVAVLGTAAVSLFRMLGTLLSPAAATAAQSLSLCVFLALPALLAWPLVARRRLRAAAR